jgi:hypothetical protein
MATTQLSLYQEAIRLFGDARLDVITDDAESRYALDDAWEGAVVFCLRAAAWRFATKNVALPDLTPGSAVPGFAFVYQHPADWLRTLALYVLGGPNRELEHPIDAREETGKIFTHISTGVCTRYISSDFADPELAGNPWPEHFAKAVAAYLAFQVADRLTNSAAAGVRMSELFGSLMAEAVAHDALPEDDWLRYQLDGSFQKALLYVLAQGYWRFALKTVDINTSSGTPDIGYPYSYPQPDDWLRSHALFVSLGDGREHPLDIREAHEQWSTAATHFAARYVSSDLGLDPINWPQPFLTAVLAYLTPAPAPSRQQSQDGEAPPAPSNFRSALAMALAAEGEPEDPWLRRQLDGSFLEGVRYVLVQGYWRFALRTAEFQAAPITQPPATIPIIGYPYSYPQPDDWLRTHAFFVPAGDGREYPIDVKEDHEQWSTTSQYFAVRYVSSDLGLDPLLWPEPFLVTLLSYLQLADAPDVPQQTSRTTGQPIPAAAAFRTILTTALAVEGEPENPWRRFQTTGAFLRACFHVAETGRWKFAIATIAIEADATLNENANLEGTLPANIYGDGSISPSYSAVFAKPADWLRTIWVYRVEPHITPNVNLEGWPDRHDVDYRDEKGNWHTNWRTIQVRYVRRAAIESWRWPQSYADAVLAWLEYEEARTDPKATAIAAAKQKIYEDMVDKAAKSDDMQEFPPYRRVGHLVRGRYSRIHGHGAQDFTRF